MKLNIYKNQKEIEKTYEVEAYDLMYGIEDSASEHEMLKVISANRNKITDLLMDVFADEGLTEEELRRIKLKELVPFFVDLFEYVYKTFGAEKN